MNEEKLDQQVDRLWQQMRYAYEHGGGSSGHLKNAWHTAMLISQELRRLKAMTDELNEVQVSLRNELRSYREREKTMGWSQT
jgi:hypothetical protein